MSKLRALILGIGGQDGSYLAEILLANGYEVHGLYRHSSFDNLRRIQHLLYPQNQLHLHRGDITDPVSIRSALISARPQEIYNEADQDNVEWSYSLPRQSVEVTYGGVVNLLESVLEFCPEARIFQPCSATMFASSREPLNESSPLAPMSPYACAKLGAYYVAKYYRDYHDLYVVNGILFNHDSPRRSKHYLLQKICRGVTDLALGKRRGLNLYNPDFRVDVGHALEYMNAAHRLMQLPKPDDYVIGTGHPVTIRELTDSALTYIRENYKSYPPQIAETISYIEKPDMTWGKRANPTLIADPSKIVKLIQFRPISYGASLTGNIMDYLSKGEGR